MLPIADQKPAGGPPKVGPLANRSATRLKALRPRRAVLGYIDSTTLPPLSVARRTMSMPGKA